jgi:carbonic anhydrase
MKKLVQGVIEFRQKVRPLMLGHFEKLALGQTPDVLLVTCSDSRVAVNVFASTDPGDLFVLRNVGNIVPPYNKNRKDETSVGAALDFALQSLNVRDIIICGHSECGAMIAIKHGIKKIESDQLRNWLKIGIENNLQVADHNTLSQMNVLQQIENLETYPEVSKRITEGKLTLHAWWFEIKHADIYAYSFRERKFEPLDEVHARELLAQLDR